MHIELPYGHYQQTAVLDWGRCLGVLDITDAPPLYNLEALVQHGLEAPIGLTKPVYDAIRPGESIVIIVSDSFRHTGVEKLLPTLLHALQQHGVAEEDIAFVFATGSHRPPTETEQERILGSAVYQRFHSRAYAHDPYDEAQLVYVGETTRGTPVRINRHVQKADHVLLTGAVVLHYFGGFGGGRKSLCPGVAGIDTIAHNHALNLDATEDTLDPAVCIGVLDSNPVAEDMLEAAQFCRVDAIINTVLNRHGEIAGVFIGELDAAHRQAAAFAYNLFTAPIKERADFVIASAGPAKNYIQSHKALFNAYQAVKPGGSIILLTESPEGYGGNKFAQWLSLGSPEAIIRELRKNAEINGQTALSTLEKSKNAYFVTALSDSEVLALGGQKADSLQQALDSLHVQYQQRGLEAPTFYLMPSAAYTVPICGTD